MILQTKLLKPFLYFISKVFKIFVLLRIFLYEINLLKTTIVKTPIISVGNLTVGGTGKTPVVDFLVKEFQKYNLKPVILSRGYGRKKPYLIKRLRYCEGKKIDLSHFGDEPFLLALRNPKVPVFVGNSRVKLAKLAKNKDRPDVIILDDAYQHLSLHRDLNLLLIDSETGLGGGDLLPLGILREPEDQCKRADAIILTKSNLDSSNHIQKIIEEDLDVSCPIFKFEYNVKGLYRLDGKFNLEKEYIKSKKLLAVSGVAQPKSFASSIKKCGGEIISKIDFSDHHFFRKEDIKKISNEKKRSNPDLIVTTEKDAVKLRAFTEIIEDIWVLEMEIEAKGPWNDFLEKFIKSKFVQVLP